MFSVHHQESSTVHTAIGICHTGFADCLLVGSGWNRQFHSDHATRFGQFFCPKSGV